VLKVRRKHGVDEREARLIMQRHAPWYGKPIHMAMNQA
jgi:hypothetical protein